MRQYIIRYRNDPNGKIRKMTVRQPYPPTVSQASQMIPARGAEVVSIQPARH